MNRSVLTFVLLGGLVAAGGHAQFFEPYLEFEHIDLTTRENGDLYSTAEAKCFAYSGTYDDDCYFVGEHLILEAHENFQMGYEPYAAIGTFSGSVRTTPIGDGAEHCYRARITGRIPGTSFSQYRGSIQRCVVREPIDTHPGCPILIDLDMNGFHLAGVEEAVSFDLNADGFAERLAWTAEGEGDGFLCRDRNGNGTIDDGRELFSQETLLATGERAQVAYAALAELDRPELGGNSDGFVGGEDAAFHELCVWVDGNHDAVSQPWEVSSLSEAGIVRLGVDFRESRHRDAHDNLFRYMSQGWIVGPGGRPRVANLYDVFFRVP